MILFNSGREVVDILTVYGYIPITRTILRPKDKEDIDRLKKLTGKKSVIPLDIALHIDMLPFKVTRAMMLQISRDAIDSRSYKHLAEKYKTEKNIEISADQIRLITDYVGECVCRQDDERSKYALSTLSRDKKLRKSGKIVWERYI